MRGVLVLLVGACGSGSTVPTIPSTPCAVDGVTGTVPGVTLAIRAPSCVIPRGTGTTFTYDVTTDGTTPALAVPGSGGGCGPCGAPSSDPESLVSVRIGGTSSTGETQRYCLCDVGCCPPTQEQTLQLATTMTTRTYPWSGRTWDGPSDTGNPEGDFFIAGVYAVTVTFNGFSTGTVVAELPIEIVDP